MYDDSAYEIVCMVLGVLVIIIGRFIPDKTLLTKTKKYKERDPQGYVKSSRKALYLLGVYYIFIGALMIFISKDPVLYVIYNLAMPFLPFIPLVFMIKKFT
jgi:hypothetical protein